MRNQDHQQTASPATHDSITRFIKSPSAPPKPITPPNRADSAQDLTTGTKANDHKEPDAPNPPVKKFSFNPAASPFTPTASFIPTAVPTVKPPSRQLVRPSLSAQISSRSIVRNLLRARANGGKDLITTTFPFLAHCIGPARNQRLKFSTALGRIVLGRDSELRLRGVELGLPQGYVEWMCGVGGYTGDSFRIWSAELEERRAGLDWKWRMEWLGEKCRL